jgi:hypothetical protein
MKLRTLAAALVFALTGAVAFAQDVTFDFDRTADFSRYRTYAWVRGTEVPDQFNHARIVAALGDQLASRRMVRVDAAARPDVFVAYHAVLGTEVEVSGFSNGWGGYRFGPGVSRTVRAQEILVGTLVVDIVDARTRTIVWRGIAEKEIDVKAKPEKRERNIHRAAVRLFAHYPPVK